MQPPQSFHTYVDEAIDYFSLLFSLFPLLFLFLLLNLLFSPIHIIELFIQLLNATCRDEKLDINCGTDMRKRQLVEK